ncbi:MAG: hypothetical protein ABI563_10210 [Specibacter sp.]
MAPAEWIVLELLVRNPGRMVSQQQVLTEAGMGYRFVPQPPPM